MNGKDRAIIQLMINELLHHLFVVHVVFVKFIYSLIYRDVNKNIFREYIFGENTFAYFRFFTYFSISKHNF